MRVLSIDWDYFIQEPDSNEHDWTFTEESFFYEAAWVTRRARVKGLIPEGGKLPVVETLDLTRVMPFIGSVMLFAELAEKQNYEIAIADSHKHLGHMLSDKTDIELINIDAHHDLWYYSKCLSEDDINCGNWGSWLIGQQRISSWTQIYPTWRKHSPEQNRREPMKWANRRTKLRMRHRAPRLGKMAFDLVYICRSSCWTPPEYDKMFNQFVLMMGAPQGIPERSCAKPTFSALAHMVTNGIAVT